MHAQTEGRYNIVHWCDSGQFINLTESLDKFDITQDFVSNSVHEQHIIERTLDACPGGVDVIIDFVSSNRSVARSLKLLKPVRNI